MAPQRRGSTSSLGRIPIRVQRVSKDDEEAIYEKYLEKVSKDLKAFPYKKGRVWRDLGSVKTRLALRKEKRSLDALTVEEAAQFLVDSGWGEEEPKKKAPASLKKSSIERAVKIALTNAQEGGLEVPEQLEDLGLIYRRAIDEITVQKMKEIVHKKKNLLPEWAIATEIYNAFFKDLPRKLVAPKPPVGYEENFQVEEMEVPKLGAAKIVRYLASPNVEKSMVMWVSHALQVGPGLSEDAETAGTYAFLVPTGANLFRSEVAGAIKEKGLVMKYHGKIAEMNEEKSAPSMVIGPHNVEGIKQSEADAWNNAGIDIAVMMDWRWNPDVLKKWEEKGPAKDVMGAERYPPLGAVLDSFKGLYGYRHVLMHTCRTLLEQKRRNVTPDETHLSSDLFDLKDEQASEMSRALRVKVGAADKVDPMIVKSVESFLLEHWKNIPDSVESLLVVDGEKWTCYIRCVLHALGKIGVYNQVMSKVEQGEVNVSSGVTVPSPTENKIIEIIAEVTEKSFHVEVADVRHGGKSQSENLVGSKISLLLTSAHFNLVS